MDSFPEKASDLSTPHDNEEAETNRIIQDPTCAKCHGGRCDFLAEFMMFEPDLLDKESGMDTRYSIWQCPTCHQYYLREWIVDWKSGSSGPAPYQFILTHALSEHVALKILDLVAGCPDPMTRAPETCKCELHEQLALPFVRTPAIWSSGKGRLVERVPFPDAALQSLLTFGVDYYQGSYQRKRREAEIDEA